jgi:hypothetical protein
VMITCHMSHVTAGSQQVLIMHTVTIDQRSCMCLIQAQQGRAITRPPAAAMLPGGGARPRAFLLLALGS